MLFIAIITAALICGVALWSSRKPDVTAGLTVAGVGVAHIVGPIVVGLAGGHWTGLFGPVVQTIVVIVAWLALVGFIAGAGVALFHTVQNRVKAVPALVLGVAAAIFSVIEPHFTLITLVEMAGVTAIVMGVASVYFRAGGLAYPWVARVKEFRGQDVHDVIVGSVDFVFATIARVVSIAQHAVDASFSFVGRCIAAGKSVVTRATPLIDEMYPQEYALQMMGEDGERALTRDEIALVALNVATRVQTSGNNRRTAFILLSDVQAVCDVLNAAVIDTKRGANGINYVTLAGFARHNPAAPAEVVGEERPVVVARATAATQPDGPAPTRSFGARPAAE